MASPPLDYRYYSMGRYKRNITEFFEHFNPDMTGGFPMCTWRRATTEGGEMRSNTPCIIVRVLAAP